MLKRVIVCLDGSSFAEQVLPCARALAASCGAELELLRVAEGEQDLVASADYLQQLASRLDAQGTIKRAATDVAAAIVEEIKQRPGTMAALTTHGRTGLLERVVGSVALGVAMGAGQPVLLYRPRASVPQEDESWSGAASVRRVVVPLDGSEFSETILPFAAGLVAALKGELELVQVLPPTGTEPRVPGAHGFDIVESAYLKRQAAAIQQGHGLQATWDVLHGEPINAICLYLKGKADAVLAMSSHARGGLGKLIFGGVTRGCLRGAGVPTLVYLVPENAPKGG